MAQRADLTRRESLNKGYQDTPLDGSGGGERGKSKMQLRGKKAIVIGERDGIQGPAIEACVRSAGAEPVLVQTQCFV
jgi:glycine reductase